MPFIETNPQRAAKFDEAFGVERAQHEAILDRLQERYHSELIRASIQVTHHAE